MSAFSLVALALLLAVLLPLLRPLWLAGVPPARPAPRRLGLALALGLPLLAAALYAQVGTPSALVERAAQPPAAAEAAAGTEQPIGPAQVNAMVERLAQRLQQAPDDEAGWRLLARSYERLQRYADAAHAYEQLERLRPADADVLTDHAVVLGMSEGQRLGGAPEALLQRALALDPRHAQALALLGSAAYEREDYAGAARVWRRLLASAPQDPQLTASITDSVARAEALAAQQAPAR